MAGTFASIIDAYKEVSRSKSSDATGRLLAVAVFASCLAIAGVPGFIGGAFVLGLFIYGHIKASRVGKPLRWRQKARRVLVLVSFVIPSLYLPLRYAVETGVIPDGGGWYHDQVVYGAAVFVYLMMVGVFLVLWRRMDAE